MWDLRPSLLLIILLARAGHSQQPVRVADAACEECHRALYKSYLATPMANASGRATDQLRTGEFTHAASGVTYKISTEENAAYLSYADSRDRRVAGKHRLEYFLGSGHLGTTYLYTQEGYLLESPVAWYAATSSYDMKPGYGQLTEMPPALPMEAGCLRCHMSGVSAPQPGTANRYASLPFQQTGITCESCHGDTRAHVRTRGKAAVTNPARLDADRRDSICISCHLEGDITVKRADHSALAYRPGGRISDYLSYFVLPSQDPLDRGVSEVEQFAASHCKRASGDAFSCTTCHDPHASPDPAQRVAFYRAKCLTCHSDAAFASTHHPDQPDCTGCHMQRGLAQNIPHVAWTDHRILRQPQAAVPRATAKSRGSNLTAIFSPQATERDYAVAGYTATMTGLLQDRTGALDRLKKAYAQGARDAGLLEALGVLSAMNGDAAESEARFRELLVKEPENFTALSNLGIYVARRGDLQAAAAMWKPVFARNQDQLDLARNLAIVQCAIGDDAGAKVTMAGALAFSPGARDLRAFTCPAPKPPALAQP